MGLTEKITRLERDVDAIMKAQDNLKFMRNLDDESMKLIPSLMHI